MKAVLRSVRKVGTLKSVRSIVILETVIDGVLFLSRDFFFLIGEFLFLVTLFFVFKRRDISDDFGETFLQIFEAAECIVRFRIGTVDFLVDVAEVRLGREAVVILLYLCSLCRNEKVLSTPFGTVHSACHVVCYK